MAGKRAKSVYLIVCQTGDLHPQTFQAGRSKYGAYHSRKAAERARDDANREFSGHTIAKFERAAARKKAVKRG